MAESQRFHYLYSCEIEADIEIKIGTLEGERDRPSYNDLMKDPMLRFSGAYGTGCSDLYVTCRVYNDGKPISLVRQTAYKAFSTRWNWNEWLRLPLQYCELPRTAMLAFTIWDIYGTDRTIPLGGTTISMFDEDGIFRQGMHDLKIYQHREADPSEESTTPGKSSDPDDQMANLARLTKQHRDGHMVKVDWLDRLSFREIELINESQKRDSNHMYLMIEFPFIHNEGLEYAVVYFEKGGDIPAIFNTQAEMVVVPDPEIAKENLVESKHHKLARSLRSGPTDKDMKPDAKTRDLLNIIVGYPPTKQLSSEEQDLVWKYRFYLKSQKKALTKFLKCVNWSLPMEATQALELLNIWNPMDVEDALELLSPSFAHPAVRKYAVSRLRSADDEDLLLYLLQLVQALKYEDYEKIKEDLDVTPPPPPRKQRSDSLSADESLAEKLQFPPKPASLSPQDSHKSTKSSSHDSHQSPPTLTKASPQSASSETRSSAQDSHLSPPTLTKSSPQDSHQAAAAEIHSLAQDSEQPPTLTRSASHDSILEALGTSPKVDESPEIKLDKEMDLATFLISRACHNLSLANYLYWYLTVESEEHENGKDQRTKEMYYTVFKRFSTALVKGGSECRLRRAMLVRQQTFMDKLVSMVKMVTRESGNRKKKIEKLQALLQDQEVNKTNFAHFETLPLPLDPDMKVKGIDPEKATLFKSNLMPCRLTFRTVDNKEYVTIFKHGDDLRQDQLVLQMVTLMDRLLKSENLDLKLTPYKVLATSSKHGFVQFVESLAVAEVLDKEGSIQNYFRKQAPCEGAPYGIQPDVMENYIKSCASYCVVTYLLGVGDRHLDNLLLTKTGKLFHIDFGYILGRDPKPLPPPMKLSKEMVEAMGGTTSDHFKDFKQHCYTAFLALRRSANLILNLMSLMVDANIPDIALEPDKTVKKVQDKFALHLTDEEAVAYLSALLDESVSAMMAALVEQFHKMAQYWRR